MTYNEWKDSISGFNAVFAQQLMLEILATTVPDETSSSSLTEPTQATSTGNNDNSTGTPTIQTSSNDGSRGSSETETGYFSPHHQSYAPIPSPLLPSAILPPKNVTPVNRNQTTSRNVSRSESEFIDPALINAGEILHSPSRVNSIPASPEKSPSRQPPSSIKTQLQRQQRQPQEPQELEAPHNTAVQHLIVPTMYPNNGNHTTLPMYSTNGMYTANAGMNSSMVGMMDGSMNSNTNGNTMNGGMNDNTSGNLHYGYSQPAYMHAPPTPTSHQSSPSRATTQVSEGQVNGQAYQPLTPRSRFQQSSSPLSQVHDSHPTRTHSHPTPQPTLTPYDMHSAATTPDIMAKINSLTNQVTQLTNTLQAVQQQNIELRTRLLNSEIHTDQQFRAFNLQITRYPAPADRRKPETLERIAFSVLGVLGFILDPLLVHNKEYWGVDNPETIATLAGASGWSPIDCRGVGKFCFTIDAAYPRFSNTPGVVLISCVSKSLCIEVLRRHAVWKNVMTEAGEVSKVPWAIESDVLVGKMEVRQGGGM
ncbi:hypothetical protein BJ508DRAFT_349049 [Ascobolus immersus RN42]|uniref:Uncharacterized protein n=1 Tax=Ascobolus immersus RN42 TaxID=1160509 RepID=A0A3N4I069_ASCIM|nr:hypothetical protein BJ508DRAFT_349049 [Ascobolus immersus RN42]